MSLDKLYSFNLSDMLKYLLSRIFKLNLKLHNAKNIKLYICVNLTHLEYD